MTYRNYCFTDNTLTFEVKTDFIKFCVWQKELSPTTSKEHYQGYLELSKPMRLTAMAKLYPGIHFEKRNGTQTQAIEYCKKSDTRIDGPWEYGKPARQGERTDIIALKEHFFSGKRVRHMTDELHPTYAKYMKYADKISTLAAHTINPELEVYLIIGKTGTGKTRYAYDNYPDLYRLPISTRKDIWFDGYDGQETVLIDDFAGYMALGSLLQVLDIYGAPVPIKGGFTRLTPKRIIITTNIHPNKWYKYDGRESQYEALCRRFTHVINMDNSPDIMSPEDKFMFLN